MPTGMYTNLEFNLNAISSRISFNVIRIQATINLLRKSKNYSNDIEVYLREIETFVDLLTENTKQIKGLKK